MFSAVSKASQSCCQLWNESYSTDSLSASLVTIVRNYSHIGVLHIVAVATVLEGQYLFCSELLIVQLLLKGSNYSKK